MDWYPQSLFQKLMTMIFILLLLWFSAGRAEEPLVGARYPAISPDGKTIAFSYMGDLWSVSAQGGRAHRLTDHAAYDREPVWSPDGRWIAFSSNRHGNNDVFVIPSGGGVARQLTYHTGNDAASDFSPDGRWIYFHSSRSSSSSIYKIPFEGGNAIPVLDTYWSWPYHARVSPDGKTLVFSLGMENQFWWRQGYRGANSAKIWIHDMERNEARLLLADESNCFNPIWNSDGSRVIFLSDREFGERNVWSVNKDGTDLRPLTQDKNEGARYVSGISNHDLVIESGTQGKSGIRVLNTESLHSRALAIEAPAEMKDNRFFHVKNGDVTEFRLSPDGRKIAAVVRGDIFVLSSEGGYARNITNTPWRERDVDWDGESKRVVYVSDADADPELYIVSAKGDEAPEKLTNTDEDALRPRFSPDGRWIAYYRGKRQLRVMRSDGKQDRLVTESDFGGRFADAFAWSPDSRFLAVSPMRNANSDIMAVGVESGKPFPLTNTAYDETDGAWSPDGKFLLFLSNRFGHSFPEFTGKWDLYQVFLQPEEPEFEEDDFEELFVTEDEKKEKEKKENPEAEFEKRFMSDRQKKETASVVFKLENLDRQTKIVANTLGNESSFVLSPKDTSTVFFVSNIDGKRHLWKTTLKKKERGEFEPFMPQIQNPALLQMDSKGKYLYYLSSGKIGRIDVEGKKDKAVSFETRIVVDRVADYEQMLAEVFYTLKHYFYDPEHHEIDWDRTYRNYRPLLKQVREDQDFYDFANLMIGRLNSSHTGIRGPRVRRVEEPSAHVGAVWDFSGGKVILKRIIKDGPLDAQRDKVNTGDVLLAVNGKPVAVDDNIWKIFNGMMDRRVTLTLESRETGERADFNVEPISAGAESRLLLEEWIDGRQAWVKKKTGDRVAYIYMRAMGRGDLERFLKELERDAVPREGLILDLRFNFGGNVHDRVLEALTKPVYANWRRRGLSETQQSTFGFADKPIVLLTNEVTLSDGEMTANGFKAMKRGPVVGNTTYGWLIFTTGVGLMNGGYFRLPFWGCYTLDGRDLETMGGVQPDVLSVSNLNDELLGVDPQLDDAIRVMLEKIE